MKPIVIGTTIAAVAWTRFSYDPNTGSFNSAIVGSVGLGALAYHLYKTQNPSLFMRILGWGSTALVLGGIASFNKEYGVGHTILG